MELRQALPDPQALTEAQKILIRCGAVSYCVKQLLHRCQLMHQLILTTPMQDRSQLTELLHAVVRPVHTLFQAAGIPEGTEMMLTALEMA